MFETVRAKSWTAKHIRELFRMRLDDLRRTTWACVVRNNRVLVTKRFLMEADDHEVMWCLLRPGELPSWFQTNRAVRKHWPLLESIAQKEWRRSFVERQQVSGQGLPHGT